MRVVAGATKIANDSASLAATLISANKERVAKLTDEPEQEAELTEDMVMDGTRRIAFLLAKAAQEQPNG
jgi:CMP-2-keto-3-deoxyoctulosonic acid synthetase